MKLHNKKTGEIGVINLKVYGDDAEYVYDTIETLHKEWEDYIPKEPLIKDEKLKEIFREWAKLYETSNYETPSYKVTHHNDDRTTMFQNLYDFEQTIEFPGCFGKDWKNYTMEEIIGVKE